MPHWPLYPGGLHYSEELPYHPHPHPAMMRQYTIDDLTHHRNFEEMGFGRRFSGYYDLGRQNQESDSQTDLPTEIGG